MSKKQKFTVNQLVSQAPGNIVSDMDGEMVMLNISNSKYYNLGAIGGDVWNRIGEPIAVTELINSLIYDYDIERDECEQHVLSFLNQLHNEHLIEMNIASSAD